MTDHLPPARELTAVEQAAQKLLHPGSTTVPALPLMALARIEMAGDSGRRAARAETPQTTDYPALRCTGCGALDTIEMRQYTRLQIGVDGDWECAEATDVSFLCTQRTCRNFLGHFGETPEQAFEIVEGPDAP